MILAPATIPTIPGLQAALAAKAPTANPAFTGAFQAAAGTLTDPAPNQITQTWNDAADTFTAKEINITDLASGGNSRFCDFKKDGVSQFYVRKDGLLKTYAILCSYILDPNNSVLLLNITGPNLVIGGDRVNLGGNSAAFPSIKRSGAELHVRLADDSAYSFTRTKLRIETDAAPASATDTGVAGETRWDASYFYLCTAANTWVRAALATW